MIRETANEPTKSRKKKLERVAIVMLRPSSGKEFLHREKAVGNAVKKTGESIQKKSGT